MAEQFDSEMMVQRARQLVREMHQSDMYPALVGGIAGGIAGALMAGLIASRVASRTEQTVAAASGNHGARARFDIRQAIELLVVVAGLVKQAREWYYQRRRQ